MKNLTLIVAMFLFNQTLTAQTAVDSNSNQPKVQLSFMYPIGTGGTQSIHQTYTASVNILAGATGGINGVEVGSLANYTHGSVDGVQVAGMANVVKDSFRGLQLSGFTNVVLDDVQAAQGAGFANVSMKEHKGVQVSGFANYAGGKMQGAQIAGFVNAAMDTAIGLQVSGYINGSLKKTKGNQIAGFANVATGTMEGVQISGFVNYARKLKGAQLGFINVADSLDGIAIGFLSYARNGYHTFEISTNETFETNLTFKTGVNQFYNSLSAGVHWNGDKTVWGLGYGIGTRKLLGQQYSVSADLRTYGVLPDNFDNDDWESFNKLELSVGRRINSFLEVYVGGSMNLWLSNLDESQFDYLRWTGNRGSATNYNWVLYPGFQAGVRLF